LCYTLYLSVGYERLSFVHLHINIDIAIAVFSLTLKALVLKTQVLKTQVLKTQVLNTLVLGVLRPLVPCPAAFLPIINENLLITTYNYLLFPAFMGQRKLIFSD